MNRPDDRKFSAPGLDRRDPTTARHERPDDERPAMIQWLAAMNEPLYAHNAQMFERGSDDDGARAGAHESPTGTAHGAGAV